MSKLSGMVWALTIAAASLWLGATVMIVGVPKEDTGVTLLNAVLEFVTKAESVYGSFFTGILTVVIGFFLAFITLLPGFAGNSPDAGYTEFGDGDGGDGD